MNVVIQLISANLNTGPFNLYSNSDVFTTPFATGISRTTLLAGYSTTSVPNNSTVIRVTSTGICQNSVDMPITGAPTTTTTITTAVPPTTTTTTTVPSGSTTTTTTSNVVPVPTVENQTFFTLN